MLRRSTALILVLAGMFVAGWSQPAPSPDSLPLGSRVDLPAPVVFRETLFYVYSRLGPFTPAERAQAAERRIAALAEERGFRPESLLLAEGELSTEITYHDRSILSITEGDAAVQGKTRTEVGRQYLESLRRVVDRARSRRSLVSILLEVFFALVTVAVAGVGIYFLHRLFRFLARRLDRVKEKWFRTIRLGAVELLTPKLQLRLARVALRVLEIGTIVLIGFISLPVLFSIFPDTRQFAAGLLNLVLQPLGSILRGVVAYLPNLFSIAVIIVVVIYAVKFLRFLARAVEKGQIAIPGFYPDWATPTFNIVRILAFAFMLVAIFPLLPGSRSPVFQGVSVFLGLLLSLGSSSAVGNVIAGLVITYMRAFKPGDRVKIGETVGDVIGRSLLTIRVRTIKNEDVTIPNSTILSQQTVNYSSQAPEHGLILHTTVTISYNVPWATVHRLLIAAARACPGIQSEPAPFVLQTELDDSYVAYEINAYTDRPNEMANLYSALHQNIQDQFQAASVEIMSPNYYALRDGNKPTIPPTAK